MPTPVYFIIISHPISGTGRSTNIGLPAGESVRTALLQAMLYGLEFTYGRLEIEGVPIPPSDIRKALRTTRTRNTTVEFYTTDPQNPDPLAVTMDHYLF